MDNVPVSDHAQSSIVHVEGLAYVIMGKEEIRPGLTKMRLSRYRGPVKAPNEGNAQHAFEVEMVNDIDHSTKEILVRDEPLIEGEDIGPSVEAYEPPPDVTTTKMYCLVGTSGKRQWYVNKSTTPQLRREFGEPATFMEYRMPTGKNGMMHFLNHLMGDVS